MKNNIKNGDKFICNEDYITEKDEILYTKGIEYSSEKDNCITDNNNNCNQDMSGEEYFLEYFRQTLKVNKPKRNSNKRK